MSDTVAVALITAGVSLFTVIVEKIFQHFKDLKSYKREKEKEKLQTEKKAYCDLLEWACKIQENVAELNRNKTSNEFYYKVYPYVDDETASQAMKILDDIEGLKEKDVKKLEKTAYLIGTDLGKLIEIIKQKLKNFVK